MKFANASRFAEKHDVVLVGYRGVDGSSVLDCPEVESALKHSTDTCSKRTDDLAASMRRTADDIPDRWWFLPIKRGNVLAASLYGIHESSRCWRWFPPVHKRGRFGRKAGATLRLVYPIVLGLGGWLLGVLIVITTMPGVPVDDELVSVLSVGLPIGLGVHLAWVNRDWSAKTKTTGFAAAIGGALVAGWLGFNVTEGLVALITTIAGATVGANAMLLALDIAWDRQLRDRFVATTAKETLEARPSTSRPTGRSPSPADLRVRRTWLVVGRVGRLAERTRAPVDWELGGGLATMRLRRTRGTRRSPIRRCPDRRGP